MPWKLEILAFHRILPQAEKYFIPPMSLARETFSSLMRAVSNRYQVLSLNETAQKISNKELTGKVVCLTFDDGYLDNYEHAADILADQGLPATFFVPVRQICNQEVYWWDYLDYLLHNSMDEFCAWSKDNDPPISADGSEFIEATRKSRPDILARNLVRKLNLMSRKDRENFLTSAARQFGPYQGPRLLMNKKEMKKLVDSGFELGSHTVSHVPLTDLSPEQAEKEIMESRQTLEQIFNTKISSFCYPRGVWNQDLAAMVQKAGYECAVTTVFGSNSSPQKLYELKRRNMQNFQDIRSRFPIMFHLLELSGRLDFLLSSRR